VTYGVESNPPFYRSVPADLPRVGAATIPFGGVSYTGAQPVKKALARLENSIIVAAVYVMAALLCLAWMDAAVWRKVTR